MTEIGQTSAHRVKATHSYRLLHTMLSVITASGLEECPSRASYQSPSSRSSRWAGLLQPPSSPQWRARGCRCSPSSQQTWTQVREEEEEEDWSEAKSRAKQARKYRRQKRTKQKGKNSRERWAAYQYRIPFLLTLWWVRIPSVFSHFIVL